MERFLKDFDLDNVAKPTIIPFPEHVAKQESVEAGLAALLDHLNSAATDLESAEATDLQDCVVAAMRSLESEGNPLIPLFFFQLGLTAGRMSSPFRDEIAVGEALRLGFRSRITAIQRVQPFRELKQSKDLAKKTVHILGNLYWKGSTTRNLRISEMAELIQKQIATDPSLESIRACIPDGVDSIKKWLREIAPPHAQKPGRPPKK